MDYIFDWVEVQNNYLKENIMQGSLGMRNISFEIRIELKIVILLYSYI